MLELGSSFDRYTIEALLGAGGMGEVYRAFDPKLGRRVALKVVRPEALGALGALGSAGSARARLEREARMAASFDHPSVVAVFDVGDHEGATFIAMELVVGQPLRRFVGDDAVSLEERIGWLAEVARALAAGHEAGLVHRDVKPENVLVRDDRRVKLLDFGIARPVRGAVDPSAPTQAPAFGTLTEQGASVGTPLYMAPEQVRGDDLDARADQFAWGVVAYELLSGRVPWRVDRDALGLAASILGDEPAPLPASVPAVVAAVVTRALRKAAGDRFASMVDLVAALEAPPAPTPAASPPAPRARRVAPIVAGALAVAIAIVAAPIARDRLAGSPVASAPSASAAPGARAPEGPPISSSPEALAAFAEGMQLYLHDCGFALPAFERARKLDPTFAAAELRIALITRWADTAASRESIQKAARFRSRLRPREAALLDAKLPCMEPTPEERAGCEQRLRAAADAHPDDAELAFWLGETRFEIGLLDEALTSYGRVLAIDPAAAVAHEGRGFVRAYQGDFEGALRAISECLARSPSASRCLQSRILVRELAGDCRAVEADAKRIIAVAPDSSAGHRALATVAFALGQPLEASRESLRQARARMPAERRANAELGNEALLAIAAGDFDAAVAKLRALEAAVDGETSELSHAGPARMLAAVLAESGRGAEAAKVAEAFFARRSAWAADARFEDFAILKDPTMALLAIEQRAGALAPAAFAERRAAWIDGWRAKAPPFYFRYAWPHAWAAPAESPEEARAALDALPAFSPVPAFLPLTLLDAHVGRTLWLGGRRDEGVARLERATRSCRAFEHAIEWMGAWHSLGRAREEAGDKAGACDAYAKVTARWGRAKPRSVTAERTAERAKALGCPK